MNLNTIRNKISLTYIVFALTIVAVIGLVIDYEMESIVSNNIETGLLNEIDLLSNYFQNASDKSLDVTARNMHQHFEQTQIRVTVIDSLGKVLLDSDIEESKIKDVENHLHRPEVQLASVYGAGKDIRLSKSTNHEYFYVAKKVFLTENNVLTGSGYIRASLSLQKMNEQITDVRRKLFSSGVIVLLLVLALSRYISGRITKPLRKIIERINLIAKGNYHLKVDVKSNDEIKLLSESINQLTGQIHKDFIELDRLATVRSQFLANVSHELRTPLFSMQAFLETLLSGAINDSEVNKKYLNKALSHVDRLNFLLNDLIEISRIESGELKLSFRYFRIGELFTQISESFKENSKRKNISLEFDCGNDKEVFGDKSKLQQVFSNLIDNAIKYNPEGTRIKVYTKEAESSVTFFVEDSGTGIAQEHLPRLFERFYRIDKERSRETGGTGLGLAIVKHIVEAHESVIAVKSTVGEGTVFSFSLKKM